MYWPTGSPQVFTHHVRTAEVHDKQDRGNIDSDDGYPSGNVPEAVVDICTTRSDHLFASITETSLNVWSTRPTVVLATYDRSRKSIESFGENASVLFKPDGSIIAIRTHKDHVLTLAVEADPNHRVLQQNHGHSQSRRQSVQKHFGVDESYGITELYLHFRRVIKIDAGINYILATEQELVVATIKPAAVQCIRWEPPREGPQAVAQVLSKLDWIGKTTVRHMTYDRAMNLNVWIAADGSAYAVQRTKPRMARTPSSEENVQTPMSPGIQHRLFNGYCFHKATEGTATYAAINARFSLVAVALSDGSVMCYTAKDYIGNIPHSHTLKTGVSGATTGDIVSLEWSPDGYCLFVAYEKGWATWSVYGREGASTFHCSPEHAQSNNDDWLLKIRTATWISHGAEIIITSGTLDIFVLEFCRSSATSCLSPANLARTLLQTSSELQIYKGHDLNDLTAVPQSTSLWQHAQYPPTYLTNQHPIRVAVISQDGRYVAIAGRRGLAHYSTASNRWKTFSDPSVEASFAVRGGMCWFGHVLAAATENAAGHDLRLYSRDLDLSRTPLYTELFNMPIVFVGPSGEDSLLVYTYENILYHYVINMDGHKAQLIQVGQIAFHGVVRAPSRVRSVSWIVPETQLRNGDPSRDVEFASILFLVDDKLVLLQPSRTPEDELKYDLRVIAQHVEYYILMRDQLCFNFSSGDDSSSVPPTPLLSPNHSHSTPHSLRDSLWLFTGTSLRVWPDIRALLTASTSNNLLLTPTTPIHPTVTDHPAATLLTIPLDFYPLSILPTRALILGIEPSLHQRRTTPYALAATSLRTQLFLPYILRHQLFSAIDTVALASATAYSSLPYFAHACEVLLFLVVEEEVERERRLTRGAGQEGAKEGGEVLLPRTLSYLQTVLGSTTYLEVLVGLVRKTEVSVWPVLLRCVPPVEELFEEALERGELMSASGLLVVARGLEEEAEEADLENEGGDDGGAGDKEEARRRGHGTEELEDQAIRVMKAAKRKEEWELCADLARFLMGVDPSGGVLRRVVEGSGLTREDDVDDGVAGRGNEVRSQQHDVSGLGLSILPDRSRGDRARTDPRSGGVAGGDYFSASPGGY